MKVKLYQLRLNVSYGAIFGSEFTEENQADCSKKWAEFTSFASSLKLPVKMYPASVDSYERWNSCFNTYDVWKGAAEALLILSRFPREAYIDQVIEVEV